MFIWGSRSGSPSRTEQGIFPRKRFLVCLWLALPVAALLVAVATRMMAVASVCTATRASVPTLPATMPSTILALWQPTREGGLILKVSNILLHNPDIFVNGVGAPVL